MCNQHIKKYSDAYQNQAHCYKILFSKRIGKEVRLEYVNTKEQIVDIFTNPLPKDAFLYLRGKLGVIPLSKAH